MDRAAAGDRPGRRRRLRPARPGTRRGPGCRGRRARVLLVSDLLTNYGSGGLDFVPLQYHDDPPQTRRTVEALLDLDFDVLCLDHGSAIADDPKAEIRALLARTASA